MQARLQRSFQPSACKPACMQACPQHASSPPSLRAGRLARMAVPKPPHTHAQQATPYLWQGCPFLGHRCWPKAPTVKHQLSSTNCQAPTVKPPKPGVGPKHQLSSPPYTRATDSLPVVGVLITGPDIRPMTALRERTVGALDGIRSRILFIKAAHDELPGSAFITCLLLLDVPVTWCIGSAYGKVMGHLGVWVYWEVDAFKGWCMGSVRQPAKLVAWHWVSVLSLARARLGNPRLSWCHGKGNICAHRRS